VPESWDRRIERARELAAKHPAAASFLTFYSRLLAAQKASYESLRRTDPPLSGSIERDLDAIRSGVGPLLRLMVEHGPDPLKHEATQLLDSGNGTVDAMLLAWWRAPSDRQFFPKAALQPYAQRLAEAPVAPQGRSVPRLDHRCPACGGAPQLSILHAAGDADGGGRLLLCATCFTAWPYRRIRCAACGEDNEHKLAYFHSPAFDHLRVDACDSCRRYLKTVDLTRLGLAVPLVDEVAGAPLDLWARDRGYEKIELNLAGF
jgi:FdhE protein